MYHTRHAHTHARVMYRMLELRLQVTFARKMLPHKSLRVTFGKVVELCTDCDIAKSSRDKGLGCNFFHDFKESVVTPGFSRFRLIWTLRPP